MCSVQITFLDLADTGERFLGNAQLSVDNVTFSAAQLTPNRHYNVSVRASNVIGTAVSYIIISKYDNTGHAPLLSLKMIYL